MPLSVLGYTPRADEAVLLVNRNKIIEEDCLTILDALEGYDWVDKRWLAIGRTQLQQAFMSINRSIFKPERLKP